VPVERLDLAKIGSLSFENPDPVRFPALRLAADVMEMGGLAGAVFNAAKERALDHFIDGRIGFLDMASIVEMTIDKMLTTEGLQIAPISLDDVIQIDALARVRADEAVVKLG
jgi:1-deoxy-D-xylulose-5-phosphate reductoisomerase